MKNFALLIAIALTSSVAFSQEILSPKFMKALSTCSTFSDSGNVQSDGVSLKSTKKILGKKDGKCQYQEVLNFENESATVTCSFTQAQVDEIIEVMNAYDVLQKYSKEKVDVSSYAAVQDNPIVQVWSKYLMDSSVCTIK